MRKETREKAIQGIGVVGLAALVLGGGFVAAGNRNPHCDYSIPGTEVCATDGVTPDKKTSRVAYIGGYIDLNRTPTEMDVLRYQANMLD